MVRRRTARSLASWMREIALEKRQALAATRDGCEFAAATGQRDALVARCPDPTTEQSRARTHWPSPGPAATRRLAGLSQGQSAAHGLGSPPSPDDQSVPDEIHHDQD